MKAAHEPNTFRPVILAVDDEPEDLGRVERELRKRYEADYRVVCEGNAEAGLQKLRDLKVAEANVAIVIAAQRMSRMNGVEFLARVRETYPLAKRLLLINPMDRETAELLPGAMTLGYIDFFEFKLGPPPNERFHRVVTDFLEEWTEPYRSEIHALVRVVGERWSRRVHEASALLERYSVPYSFYPVDSEEGRALLEEVGKSSERLPVVVMPGGRALVDPANREVADVFVSANAPSSGQTFDVVVIGGGPAGLAAGVYGASEGLSILIVEREAIGGQAGSSSLIRNYLGFARGISGQKLTYQAFQQASLFLKGQEVYVVGGANSAGQAAMHLSKYASNVTLLVRSGSLEASMSDYLIKEIEATDNVRVRLNTQVVGGGGEGRLERLVLKDSASEHTETVPAAALFVLIGAVPRTEWLPEEVVVDGRGFVLTGGDLLSDGRLPERWDLQRPPMLLETSVPGVFAVGDVRHGSVKRVASAVGEGSIAIQMVHGHLGET